jgi:hypothetical protein
MRRYLIAFVFLLTLAHLPSSNAAVFTWAGPQGGSFSSAANWAGGVVPPSSADTTLVFPSLLTQPAAG